MNAMIRQYNSAVIPLVNSRDIKFQKSRFEDNKEFIYRVQIGRSLICIMGLGGTLWNDMIYYTQTYYYIYNGVKI
ncbi:MAG: hypothetical protein N2484_06060 [Clostridia bacterium]|nr:hypothetical protein [Clostridia bacterium]